MTICGFLDPICGFFFPFNADNILLIVGLIVAGIWIIRAVLYQRDLTGIRHGDYFLRMPFIGEIIKATVFGLETEKDVEKLIYNIQNIHQNNPEDSETLRKIMMADLHDACGYIIEYRDVEGSTRKSGKALMLTTGPLEDGAYYKERPAERNLIRGVPTRVRMVLDAKIDGFIDELALEWNGEKVDAIYFPLEPMRPPSGYKPKDLPVTEARALLGIVAKTDQILKTGALVKEMTIRTESAEEKMREAQRNELAARGEANMLGNTLADKLYSGSEDRHIVENISPFIAAGIVFISVLAATQFFPQNPPDPIRQLILGGLVGFGGVVIANRLFKPKPRIERAAIAGAADIE